MKSFPFRVFKTGILTLIMLTLFSIVQSCSAPETVDPQPEKRPVLSSNLRSGNVYNPKSGIRPVRKVRFGEIWGYLLKGEEGSVRGDEPFTDLCYFCASITSGGRMSGSCVPPAIVWKGRAAPRLHMVVAMIGNPALVRHSIDPKGPARGDFIKDIVEASKQFDGVQIDFESLPPSDGQSYLEFIRELKKQLDPSKTLSVALPARRKKLAEDAYDYAVLSEAADRLVVMAYDQHWKTSRPGPVASLPWCREVLAYSKSAIPSEKLIMGLPLYGREWLDNSEHRALKFRQVKEILEKSGMSPSYNREKGLYFEYEGSVKGQVYYDDHRTLLEKLYLYRSAGVRAVSFWRIGQGPEKLWRYIVPSPPKI